MLAPGSSTCAHTSSSSSRGEVVPRISDEARRDDLGRPGQLGLAEPPGLVGHLVQPVGGASSSPVCPASGHRVEDDQVAQPVEQVGGEPARVVAGLHHPVDGAEHGRAVPGRQRVDHLVEQASSV